MRPDFLQQANREYNAGKKIVQGRRIAKNQENAMEILDDLSEQINNHINRRGSYNLGGSSSIAGSGFLIDQKIGIDIFNTIDSVGGFDKELELVLLKQNIKTHYTDSMVVYDEKVGNTINFKNQRKRWISSQFTYLYKYFRSGIKELLLNGNIVYFNSAILRNFQLPRLLNLGLFSCLCIIIIPFIKILTINYWFWLSIYCLFLCSVFISIPKFHYNRKTLLSILKIPRVFMTMFFLLFRLKGSEESFIHTPHNIDKSFDNE
jgi:cellulose synthase/poly-beta-1,6-N-acetylglucosamine synthase-like glycosyltransferase